MKHYTLVSVALLAACATDPAAPHTHAHEQPLLGNSYFEGGCSDEDASLQLDMHEWGRIAATSAAFEQCVQTAMTSPISWAVPAATVTRGRRSGTFGPYLSCDDDPFANETPAEQARRALIVARSPNDVVVACSGSGAIATTWQIDHWNHRHDETFSWGDWFRDVQVPVCDGTNAANCREAGDAWPLSEGADTIWHEAMHTHGYRHHGNGDDDNDDARADCGRSNTPNWHFQRNTMPYIVGNCMEAVLAMSGALCDINSCGNGELSLIDGMGSNTCVCVPDPQDVDYSRVAVEIDYDGPYVNDGFHEFYSGFAGLGVPLVLGVEGTQSATLSVVGGTLPEPLQVEWRVERANGTVETASGRDLTLSYGLGDAVEFTVTSEAAYPADWLPVLTYRFEVPHVSHRNPAAIQAPSDLAQDPPAGDLVRASYGMDGLAHTDLTLRARAECLASWSDDCDLRFVIDGPDTHERRFLNVAKGAMRAWVVDWLPPGAYTWEAIAEYDGASAAASLPAGLSGFHFHVVAPRFREPPVGPAQPFGTGHYLHFDDRGAADMVTLRATSFDLNGDPITFQFEVRRFDEPFQGRATHQADAARDPVEGQRSLHVGGEIALPFDGTEHHWRVRAIDATHRASPWIYGGYYPDRGDITMVQMLNIRRDVLFDNPHLVRDQLERDFDLPDDIDERDILPLKHEAPGLNGLFIERVARPRYVPTDVATYTRLPLGTSGVATFVPRTALETVLEQTIDLRRARR